MGDIADSDDPADICDECGLTFADCDCDDDFEEECPDCGEWVNDCTCDDAEYLDEEV